MKKNSLFISLMLVAGFATSALAQFSIGPRVAANLSNVAFSSDEDDELDLDTENRFGFAFGAAVEIGITEMFAIQPELLFSQHGFKVEESFLGETFKITERRNYLQIPVLAKLTFGGETINFNVLAGPHLGFGIGEIKGETEIFGEKESESYTWEEAEIKTFDFGITGGVGVAFAAGPGKLGVDVRYQLGLVNINDAEDGDVTVSNRNLQFGVSYLIPIGN